MVVKGRDPRVGGFLYMLVVWAVLRRVVIGRFGWIVVV